MKVVKVWACVAAMAVVGLGAWPVIAEDAPAKTADAPAKAEVPAKAAAKKEPKGRLPTYFGKLGLADDKKDELYLISGEYQAKIDALTAELKQLRTERDEKLAAKLTDAQRTQLKQLREEAAARRAARGGGSATTSSSQPAASENKSEVESKPVAKKAEAEAGSATTKKP